MEFRVPPARKKKFKLYTEDGTTVSFVGYFFWEYPEYKQLISQSRLRKVTYSYNYKDEL